MRAPCRTLRKSIHNVLFIIPQLFLIPAHHVWASPKAQSIAFFSPTILQLVDYKSLSVGPLTQALVLWPLCPPPLQLLQAFILQPEVRITDQSSQQPAHPASRWRYTIPASRWRYTIPCTSILFKIQIRKALLHFFI